MDSSSHTLLHFHAHVEVQYIANSIATDDAHLLLNLLTQTLWRMKWTK